MGLFRFLIRVLVLLLLVPASLFAQTFTVMDMAGVTNGTSVSASNLNAASHCLNSATWTATISTTTYSNAKSATLPVAQGCGNSTFPGNSGLMIAWDTTTNDKWTLSKSGNFGNSITVGFDFLATVPSPGVSNTSDHQQISNSSGSENMTMQVQTNGSASPFLTIEMSGSAVPGSINYGCWFISANTHYWVTEHWKNGGTHQVQVWNLSTKTQVIDQGFVSFGNCGGGTSGNFADNIPSKDASTSVALVVFGKQGSQGSGFGTSYFGNLLVDPTGNQFPILPFYSWTPILAPQRAIDWSQAGVQGGIPSGTWTKNGSTIAAYSGTATAINTALSNAAGTNQYVLLGPGTFTLSTAISCPASGGVELRGSGASSTFLVFTVAGVNQINCSGSNTSSGPVSWTAGYAQYDQRIVVASVPGACHAGSCVVELDQCETGFSGASCSGTSTDNGNYFNCSQQYNGAGPTGCASSGPDGTNTGRYQQERHLVTAINGTTLTLAEPLMFPNWASARTPQATFYTAMASNLGVANLSVDDSGLGSASSISAINQQFCFNCWVDKVRVVNAQTHGISAQNSVHQTVSNSYLDTSQTFVAHSVARANDSYMLVQNNISVRFHPAIHCEQVCVGDVVSYNFVWNMQNNTDAMDVGDLSHSNADAYTLHEGNITNQVRHDSVHGTQPFNTVYRGFYTGYENCGNGQCGASIKDFATNAIVIDSFNRYSNLIANVMGTPGFHTTYKGTSSSQNKVIFQLGQSNSGSVTVPAETVTSTPVVWGQWDAITAGCLTVATCTTATVRWCGNSSDTGWTAVCGSVSEVGTAAPLFPNTVPALGDTGIGQGVLPASFYLPSKPSFMSSATPFPVIGPDVSGGNIGQCSGTLNASGKFAGVPAKSGAQCTGTSLLSSWGGHVNANPAMDCYLNVMGGLVDATGSLLNFDPSVCYFGAAAPVTIIGIGNIQIKGNVVIQP